MRAVIQRVTQAEVAIGGVRRAAIGRGLLVLLAAEDADGDEGLAWLAGKIARLRIFADSAGKMNLALGDVSGEALVVSQFTLFVSTMHRPFLGSAEYSKNQS